MAVEILALGATTTWGTLSSKQKHYAYHLCQAAWHGSRIVMRQTSPESVGIFDFIVELYRACSGDWMKLANISGVSESEINAFLEYASCFLSNVGNYYGKGDQKFVPVMPSSAFEKLASVTPSSRELWLDISKEVFSVPPYNLGFPSASALSQYYTGLGSLSEKETQLIDKLMMQYRILPENTRFKKTYNHSKVSITILQASVEKDEEPQWLHDDQGIEIILERGDHSQELQRVCTSLECAAEFAPDENSRQSLTCLIESLMSGDLNVYREHLRLWLTCENPAIELIFGFVEPYRDPAGVKAEFEGIVGIFNDVSTRKVKILASDASRIVGRLPWVTKAQDGLIFGPFENPSFKAPSFVCFDTLAYCSSYLFPGINLPNYNDIRERHGHKSLIVCDRMQTEAASLTKNPLIPNNEQSEFQKLSFETYELYVMLHELYGHPTGRMIVAGPQLDPEASKTTDLPMNPLTGAVVNTWYLPDQAWTTVFGDLATTVDECRCELVAAYLMDDDDLLFSLGYGNPGAAAPEDVLHNLYQQIASDGLHGLLSYHAVDDSWGSAHSQGHFAMLRWLLMTGDGVLQVRFNEQQQELNIHIDRAKIRTKGTPAIAEMLLKLHIFRCTADVKSCREFYLNLCAMTDESLEWHKLMLKIAAPRRQFIQSNLVSKDSEIVQKHYPATSEGVVKSWVERNL